MQKEKKETKQNQLFITCALMSNLLIPIPTLIVL